MKISRVKTLKFQLFHESNTIATWKKCQDIYEEKKILKLWMSETVKYMSGANRDSGSGVL